MFRFFRWKHFDCVADARTLVAALTGCAALAVEQRGNSRRWLEKGEEIYRQALEKNCSDNSFVQNALIELYARCGSMVKARSVFERMRRPDAVSWTILLQGYVDNSESALALRLFDGMSSTIPNARTFVAAPTACTSLAASAVGSCNWLRRGKSIHSRAVTSSCCDNIFVQNTLVDMYAKLGEMQQARDVFDKMSSRSVVSWTALMQGYVDNGKSEVALKLFEGMAEEAEAPPAARTFVTAITACTALAAEQKRLNHWLEKGKRIHLQAVRNRCWDVYVETAVVNLLAKCGSMAEAQEVFDKMVKRNVVSWTCLVQGYVDNGKNKRAPEVVCEMDLNGVTMNSATFVAALTACGSLMAAGERKAEQEQWISLQHAP
ncbi:pentatricopeptide repeat-containing protein At1g03540-like [Selaginella moellendorffii]|uniref:pentatricopeptide repeat-containing protein At1g03540-like n=1 Tax=Selaginella moellendorffii TaxID=88036 RepID=UPI000D1C71A7|nr:pentatricopeptide repeat-containing protein At1g03540-like [Selaginella moellendorffii]|eukprot:XP_024523531.1 pentatricopeptide repeat-containing protein At1g03540-like [Selaginella moellendorffii]